jgi:hypothetical protein
MTVQNICQKKLLKKCSVNIGNVILGFRAHIMLRDLFTQKCVQKKRLLISDTPEHVDSENINFLNRSPELALPTFKKRDFYFINVAKIGKNGP